MKRIKIIFYVSVVLMISCVISSFIIFNSWESHKVFFFLFLPVHVAAFVLMYYFFKTSVNKQVEITNLNVLRNALEQKVKQRTLELEQEKIALKYEAERNDFISKVTSDVLWDWDIDSKTMQWNDNYNIYFGHEKNNSLDSWREYIHPEDKERILKEINTILTGNEVQWAGYYRFRKKDDTYAFVLERAYVLRDNAGKAYRMVGSMMDITEQITAEKRIRNSELKFRRVFESDLMSIVFWNFDGSITDANDAFLRLLDYNKEDLKRGLNWNTITAPEYVDVAVKATEQLRKTGYCNPFEKEYLKKDGTRITALMGAALLKEGSEAEAVTYMIDVTEIKEAERKEKELQEIITLQQEEFKNILMEAPYMISIRRGKDLRLEFINKAYYNFTGRDDTGKTFEEISAGYKKHQVYDAVWNVYKTGVPLSGKALFTRYDKYKTGKLVDCWFDYTFIPLHDKYGNVNGVATFGFEVTDLIIANQEIKKNEERFRFLADAIPQKVWTAKPDGNIYYYNKVWMDYTGLRMEELENWGWQKIIHPDDLDTNMIRWMHALDNHEDFEAENRMLGKDGKYRWHLVRAVPQKDGKGNVTMWVGTNTDIHDQKTFSDMLKMSENYFRQLSDQVPFIIRKVDEQGVADYVNKTWCDFTGMSFEESIGSRWGQALHPEERENELNNFLEAFNKRATYTSKFRLRRKDGVYRWFLNQSHPLFNPEFIGYISSLTDITEQEMEQQATQLLMQKKDEFMSIASHELKTPISSMKGYLQILQRISKTDKSLIPHASFIQKANRQADKLTSLVEDLLDVTKIQAGKMQLNKSVFKISEAIQDSVDQIENNTSSHKIIINGCTDTFIKADKYRVEQVITNLLSNAIKYSPGEKEVIVDCEAEGEWLKISVTDHGIGIPQDKKDFVFDRFFRVHTSAQNFSGLGLGLYISSGIIKRHGGEIGVISHEGEGSVFWFSIPAIVFENIISM